MVETAMTVQSYLLLMPYSPHPTSDIIYRLINPSPVGTGEQLLDSLEYIKKHTLHLENSCFYANQYYGNEVFIELSQEHSLL
jgi:hypothetical protein